MKKNPYHIVARIYFYETSRGGKKLAINQDHFACLCNIAGSLHDCLLFTGDDRTIYPGDIVELPTYFLYWDDFKDKVEIASKITLWEGRTIAEGVVVEVKDK